MDRQVFFRRLEYLLRDIPENDRMDALAYYNDYFDEAGVENEQRVIQELGAPEQVAQIILEEYHRGQHENYGAKTIGDKIKGMSILTKILLVVVIVLTSPLWIGIVAGLFGALVGLVGSLFGVIVGIGGAGIGALVGGIGCFVVGVMRLLVSPVAGIVSIGVGAIFIAVSMLLILLFVLLVFKWLPTLVKAIIKWVKGFRYKQRGGDEI